MKMLLKAVLALALCAAAVNAAFEGELSTVLNGLQARENNVRLNIKDMTSVQALELGSASQPVITSYVKGNRNRQDTSISIGGKDSAQILLFDGKDSWLINSMMKMKVSALQMPRDFYSELMKTSDIVNLQSKVLRTEKMYGRDAYVVESVYKEKDTVKGSLRVWLDKENFNNYQMVYLDTSGKETMKLVYMDYRKVYDKIQMPYRIEMYQGGQLANRMVVRSIKVNQNLADTFFDASQFKVPEQPDISALMATMAEQQAGGAKGSGAADYLKMLQQQEKQK